MTAGRPRRFRRWIVRALAVCCVAAIIGATYQAWAVSRVAALVWLDAAPPLKPDVPLVVLSAETTKNLGPAAGDPRCPRRRRRGSPQPVGQVV